MTNRKVTILGCGSAKPTKHNTPSSQLLEMNDKQFLIDCGEGAQIALAQMNKGLSRLNNIFISHLHGDHCFGLIGLLSTLGMLGRTGCITIHAHADLQTLLKPQLDYFCKGMAYEVKFNAINPRHHELIYEDRGVRVTSLPLKHRVPCCGYLFEEKERAPHLNKEIFDFYHLPLASIPSIKEGNDICLDDGTIIPNARLTIPAEKPYSYAYCSDTMYYERLVEWIAGIDCLYHEATYANDNIASARQNMHSTAEQAATIAKKAGVGQLIIGHFSARYHDQSILLNEARAVFANTTLATDRTVIPLQR